MRPLVVFPLVRASTFRRTEGAARPSGGVRLAAIGLLALWSLLQPRRAFAKDSSVVVYVEGTDAGSVASALQAAVPQRVHVVDPQLFRAALAARGQKGPFGKQLDRKSRAAAVDRLGKARAATGADAALVARVTREKNRRRVLLLLVDSAGNATELDSVVLGPSRTGADEAQLTTAVRPALEKYKSASEEGKALGGDPAATSPVASPSEEAKPPAPLAPGTETNEDRPITPQRPRNSVSRSLFALEADVSVGARNFRYNQPITPNLRAYDVVSAPIVHAAGELFPLADTTQRGALGLLRDIGVFGEYARALFLKSTVPEGIRFDTNETAYMLGVRARLRPFADDGLVFGISDAYAVQLLSFSPSGTAIESQLPAVNYAGNRVALDARVPFGRLAAFAAMGYRFLLDGGPVESRFRGSTVNGVDAQVGAAFVVAAGWELRLAAEYDRYFYAFKPRPGDPFVAGGALDQFFAVRFGLAYIY